MGANWFTVRLFFYIAVLFLMSRLFYAYVLHCYLYPSSLLYFITFHFFFLLFFLGQVPACMEFDIHCWYLFSGYEKALEYEFWWMQRHYRLF